MFSSKPSKNHVVKQQIGLLSALATNSYAYRKLGPAMIKKYINMAKTGKLFELRNRCLYVDVVGDSLLAPSEIILETEALELVCLAMEVFAELSSFGAAFLDDSYGKEATDKWVSIRKETNKFEEKYSLIPKKEVGKIANYLARKEVAIIDLIGDLKINDEVVIEGPKTVLRQKVTSIKIKDNEVSAAKAGCRIGVKVDAPVKRNDVVYRIIK